MKGLTQETIPILLLSPQQAARALGICERTLFTRTKTGEIPAVRIGRCVRYSVDALREYVKQTSERNL